MLKRLRLSALLVLLVIFLGIISVIAVEYYEPSQRHAEQEAKDASKAKALDILASERVAYYTKVLAIFTGILSGFGLFQIYFLTRADRTARIAADAARDAAKAAGSQAAQMADNVELTMKQTRAAEDAAKAAGKSADISERALLATQRAYVSAKPAWSINITKPLNAVTGLSFWMMIDNGGNTPALNMANRSAAAFIVKKEGEGFDFAKLIGPTVLPADKTSIGLRSGITTDHQEFSIERMAMVRDGTADLFLAGWLEYDDVFVGTPRHGVEWCFKVSIEGKLRPEECQARFDTYDQHNRYYDCPPEIARTE